MPDPPRNAPWSPIENALHTLTALTDHEERRTKRAETHLATLNPREEVTKILVRDLSPPGSRVARPWTHLCHVAQVDRADRGMVGRPYTPPPRMP